MRLALPFLGLAFIGATPANNTATIPALPEVRNGEVITVTAASFDEVLKQHAPLLVQFYAPWCAHCKELAPHYSQAAIELDNVQIQETLLDKVQARDSLNPSWTSVGRIGRLAKCDGTKTSNEPLLKQYGITSFPTLKWFPDKSGTRFRDFHATRDVKGIVEWVTRHSRPAAETIFTAHHARHLTRSTWKDEGQSIADASSPKAPKMPPPNAPKKKAVKPQVHTHNQPRRQHQQREERDAEQRKENYVGVIGLFKDLHSEIATAFIEVAEEASQLQGMFFHFGYSEQKTVMLDFGVSLSEVEEKGGVVLLFKKFAGDVETQHRYEGNLKVAAGENTDASATERAAIVREMAEWCELFGSRVVETWSEESSSRIFARSIKYHLLVFVDEAASYYTELHSQMLELGLNPNLRGRVLLVEVPLSEKGVHSFFSIDTTDLPTRHRMLMVHVDPNQEMRRWMYKNPSHSDSDSDSDSSSGSGRSSGSGSSSSSSSGSILKVEHVEQWIGSVLGGKESEHLRSEPERAEDWESDASSAGGAGGAGKKESSPKVLVGSDFVRRVLGEKWEGGEDQGKLQGKDEARADILVMFYAPWCGHSQQLLPIYGSLASRISSVPSIKVAKMDKVANDLPANITALLDLKGYPTVKLFRGDSPWSPIDYHGDRSEEGLLLFLREHASEFKLDGTLYGRKAAHSEL